MKMIQKIHDWLDRLIAPPSLTEIVALQMHEAALLKQQAEHVILTHEFQKHMAQKKIAALNDWMSLGVAR